MYLSLIFNGEEPFFSPVTISLMPIGTKKKKAIIIALLIIFNRQKKREQCISENN